MAAMKCILGLLVLLTVSAWTEATFASTGTSDSLKDDDDLTVAEQLQKANRNLKWNHNGIQINGDIAVSSRPTKREADPCVLHGCTWLKDTDGKVYVPYVIANHYFSQELDLIKRAMDSFSSSTCIRFIPRTNQTDYLYIQSLEGCFSSVGRRGNGQMVSLSRRGCIYLGTVQHELLHALGFNHEHCRSDRDQHIKVLLENVIPGREYNFNKFNTLNEETPYDYDSVMHYGRLAFSKDNVSPTMMATHSSNAVFGTATQMSQNDVDRINLLYCSK